MAAARYSADAGVTGLITRLRAASPEFARLWAEHDVHITPTTTKRIRHPEIGVIELDCESLHDPERDQWVIIYTARPGTPAHDALRLLQVIGDSFAAAPPG